MLGEVSFARARAEDSLAALLDAGRGSVGVETSVGSACGCGSCWGSAWVAMVDSG